MTDLGAYETTAQIAVGLVGFAALLNYLARDSASADEHSAARGDSMLELAVMALVGSFVPEILSRCDVEITLVWKIGSATLAIYLVSLYARIAILVKRTGWGSTVYHLVPSIIFGIIAMCHQALNAVGKSWPDPESAYYIGIVFLIISSAGTFLAQYKLENKGAWMGKK